MITSRILFLKSEPQQPKAGEHWITVRPPGHEKGQPILVQDQPDGSMKVVGGAGGALNHLRFTPGHKGEDRKAVAAKRQEEARAAKNARIERDKELGLHEAKQGVRKKLADQRRAAEKEFISSVADQMGWDKAQLEFPAEKFAHLSDKAQAKLQRHHHAALLKQATKAVDQHREWLVHDHAARAEAGLGELPLVTPDAETVSVQDLDPVNPSGASLGYSADFAARADAAGASQAAIRAEIAESKPPMTDEQRSAALARGKAAEMVKDEIASIADPVAPTLQTKIDDAKKAVSLIAARKRLDGLRRQLADAGREVDAAVSEPKAPVLELDDEKVAEDVRKQIADDLKTASTRAFLSATAEVGEENLRAHIGVGAYNSLNALSLTASGAALLDRSVVDVLGISGAAQVLARRLKADLSPDDYQRAADGMAEYHASMHADRANEAVSKAKEAQDLAEAIDVDAAHDLTEAQALNHTRRDAIEAARRALGTALGELEANAALVAELKTGARDEVQVPMGSLTPQAVVTQLRAIGLQKGDCLLDKVGGETFVTINADGLDRLTAPVNKADMEQVRRNLAIIRGEHDEDDWLPIGFANRRDLAMHVEPGVVQRMAEPFSPGEDLAESLRDYIGGRAADGDTPADIVADIQSAAFFDKAGAERRKEYAAALEAVAPLKDAKGKMQRAEALQGQFEAYADAFVEKRGAARLPLHRQKIDVDQVSVDALHRALADHPDGVAAYKPVGDLTKQDQRSLRDFFYREIAHESPEAADLRHQYEGHLAAEPEKETVDMFGETTTNPEWSEWRARRDELSAAVGKSSLDWQKYVDSMRGHAKAYESLQDVIRSRVSESFAQHHNRLRPDAPVAVGRTVIRNNLNHLDAVDPAAREARAAKERELIDALRDRVAGKYASGSVKDKLDAAKEQQAAFEQAQMGFFSTEDLFGADDTVKESAPLAADERHTLGHAAEMQIAGMMGIVGRQFKPGQPVKLWNVSMNGKYAPQQRAIKMLEANKRLGLGFGAGCVDGATQMRCEATGVVKSFYDWWLSGELPHVLAASNDGSVVVQQASDIFVKGFEEMLLVTLDNGASIAVTAEHLVLSDGCWVRSGDLVAGSRVAVGGRAPASHEDDAHLMEVTQSVLRFVFDDMQPVSCDHGHRHPTRVSGCRRSPIDGLRSAALFHAVHQSILHSASEPCGLPQGLVQSIAERALSARASSGRHSLQTASGSQDGCLSDLRLCGGRLRDHGEFARSSSPSRDGAQARSQSFSLSGDQDKEQGHTRPCPVSCLRSMQNSDDLPVRLEAGDQCRGVSCGSGSSEDQRHSVLRSVTMESSRRGTSCADHQDQCSLSFPAWSEWSVVRSVEKIGRRIVFDMTVPRYHNYFAHGVLHHNSGKTSIMLGAFSHLHGKGKIKRAVMLVPSIVQGQFGGEALRYLEPGKYKWHAEPGASRAERIAAYKDPDTHFVVQTHQSFRDDMIYLGAQHEGIEPSEMTERLRSMSPADRQSWIKGVMEKEGIAFDATMVDEAHETLNREGKQDSTLANVTDALSAHTPYYVYASGDPVKNDVSEAFDLLRKCDPARYTDRAAFMRRYGVDTDAARSELKREMARYVYSHTISPDVTAHHNEHAIELSGGQKAALKEMDGHFARARLARMRGQVDVDALRAISPSSFDGVPEDQHHAVAAQLQKSLGMLKPSVERRIINGHPDNAKIEKTVELAKARHGRQGVVFAHSLSAVEATAKRLQAEGFRVVTITGADSSKDKDAKRKKFTPESGEPEADIMVASDAAAVGMNLQSGRYLIQHDTPDTAKNHGQRNARIHRLGQKNDVELHDLVADHSSERRARARLSKKYGLRELMLSPMDALDDTGLAYFLHQRKVASQADQGGLF